MKGNGCLLIIVFFSTLTACTYNKKKVDIKQDSKTALTNKTATKKDTAAYVYKTFYLETKGNGNYFQISYPIFENNPQLNNFVINYAFKLSNSKNKEGKNPDGLFKELSEDFFANLDSSSSVGGPISSTSDIKVIMQDPSLIVLQIVDGITGGAHPNYNYSFINWNAKTDRLIKLDDILIKNYDSLLTKTAENIFRKDKKLGDTDSLENYDFENGVFALNGNFRITPKGINFFYNAYEIQAYSEGPTELLIPYSSIKSLLRPNTIITQYIN